MKRKFLAIIMIVITLMTLLTGCGNMSLGIGNYNYQKVHVDTYHYSGCFTVEKWYEDDTGIEVKTEEAGSIYLSEGTYILLEGHKVCPFCNVSSYN